MEDRVFDVRRADKLDKPERIKALRPLELLKDVAGIKAGYTCVDFGSGTGTFALPMAKLVGDKGVVYAIDSSDVMLGHIKAKNPPPNLILVNSDVNKTGLESSIADVCLLAFILHEVEKPENFIAEAARLLKPGGKIIIAEWKEGLDSSGPPSQIRISSKQIKQLLEKAGLSMVNHIEWSENHYVAIGE